MLELFQIWSILRASSSSKVLKLYKYAFNAYISQYAREMRCVKPRSDRCSKKNRIVILKTKRIYRTDLNISIKWDTELFRFVRLFREPTINYSALPLSAAVTIEYERLTNASQIQRKYNIEDRRLEMKRVKRFVRKRWCVFTGLVASHFWM